MVIYALTQDPNTLTGAVARYLNALTERPFGVRCWAGVMGEIRENRETEAESHGAESRERLRKQSELILYAVLVLSFNTFVTKLVFVFDAFIK